MTLVTPHSVVNHCVCQRWVTWPVSKGTETTTYLESRPHIAYSLCNFYGATMTINGSLQSVPIVKRFSALRIRRIIVIYKYGVSGNQILGIPDPTLPIHYVTFMGLWWRFRAVYSWVSPLLSGFRPKIFCPVKITVSKVAVFRENSGLTIKFWLQDPQEAHPWCVERRLVTYFAKRSV